MQYPSKKTLLLAGVAFVVFIGLAAGGVHYSSQTSFCLSCHEMRVYQDEQRLSAHAKDANQKEIGCAQCHIPNGNVLRMLGAKAWMGLIDVWVHTTEANLELDRAAMQPVARRFTDDANCLSCHKDRQRNAKNDGPISTEGSLAHNNYDGQKKQSNAGCVSCHQNLAHLPVFDARIPQNHKFALKLKEQRS